MRWLLDTDWPERIMMTMLAGCVALLGYIIYDGFIAWPLYAEQNGCEPTQATRIRTVPICNMIGKVMICHPTPTTQTLWRCSQNNERHWR